MAKIKVTRMNFTDYVKNHVDNLGAEGLFATMLLGGKEKMKELIGNLPDQQEIWLNTDYVYYVSTPYRIPQADCDIFTINIASANKDDETMHIKADSYEAFLKAWKGE